ncbi:FAD/FMN-containing dehydrogenase/Fe-S oxidoreductase [Rhizobium mesoamericanum]|uniref:FAD-binding and (Fe-S)-binding domain-containing protein n=1 Tax=Rhizobium mesoamericanum TaxID=1079800 RepID=UPI00277D5B54|nr:FAD-binding and (Fe-S)-binding domain-containing protein [Rhizobium mesoamericanum]MDQ0560151.1 FAD/FMN-containing dehydrogenase/Fe-S oxidoreductase [Rhizobium mesoamericanum]
MLHQTINKTSYDIALQRLPFLLKDAGFEGDITADAALLAAMSTDNSIYTIMPDIVVAPRDSEDVRRLMRVLEAEDMCGVPVTARGGGTGTNGQSLNTGIIVDFQKYMNRLLNVNIDEQWVDVEPGIVLDELNAQLAASGLFFAPTTSTASRCTIGGMVSTDASGKGSRRYGKTSDNVLGMEIVLDGGRTLDSAAATPDWARAIFSEIEAACESGRDALLNQVPTLSRRFTGYDLERAKPPEGDLEWWRLPIGAEGTLGLVTRVRLRLLRKPKLKRLIVIGFETFAAALDAGSALLAHDPLAIEVMDEWVQGLADKAGILQALPASLRAHDGQPIAYNFIEFVGDDEADLMARVETLRKSATRLAGAIASHVAVDDIEMAALWQVRAASVGLLGKVSGTRRPIAFVEDCVVPVENLAAFVKDFTALLNRNGLNYGMYGHVDVGCLHIRPALNIDRDEDRVIMKTISDGVFELTRRHGGIFWGEHGKGVRGAYLAEFAGAVAYDAFRRIKRAFDPKHRFNPGKLVGEPGSLMGIETTPFRSVNTEENDPLSLAFKCNGNAQCLSYQRSSVMCPSFKATRDLRHSPKGRADALRHWHQAHRQGRATKEMENDVLSALDGCLGCKACATSCPVQVDIPEMRSHFLDRLYRKRRREFADKAALLLEEYSPVLVGYRKPAAVFSRTFNAVVEKLSALRDLPRLAFHDVGIGGYQTFSANAIAQRQWHVDTIFIWQDPFTALFDIKAALALADGLRGFGYRPVFVTMQPGGKAAHVLGDRARFVRQARKLRSAIDTVASSGRPMVGVDPAFVMMIRQEFVKAGLAGQHVLLVQEFLSAEIASGRALPKLATARLPRKLFLHCSESGGPGATAWKKVFAALGAPVEIAATGCCGMAGLFGHQERHHALSRRMFELSWTGQLKGEQEAMVSGFSCRCQTKRFSSIRGEHPMRWMADAIAAE